MFKDIFKSYFYILDLNISLQQLKSLQLLLSLQFLQLLLSL